MLHRFDEVTQDPSAQATGALAGQESPASSVTGQFNKDPAQTPDAHLNIPSRHTVLATQSE
jgi:hypothetical protein